MLEETTPEPREEARPRTLADRLHPAAKREERLTALAELYAGGGLSQREYELHRTEILDEL
jgi:hypothetical protein